MSEQEITHAGRPAAWSLHQNDGDRRVSKSDVHPDTAVPALRVYPFRHDRRICAPSPVTRAWKRQPPPPPVHPRQQRARL